jgi:hypothetical protein
MLISAREIQMTTEAINRSIYQIPERNLGKFKDRMTALSKRSIKLGFPAIEPIILDRTLASYKDKHGRPVYILDIYLDAVAPKMEGWTFVARLDHANETGNIIRTIPNSGVELPSEYRNSDPHCDHCKINRKRRDTFVVRNDETGDFQQVGSSCLIDFFGGYDPMKMAKMAELLGYADEVGRAATGEAFVMRDKRWIVTAEYIVYCAVAIRKFGWVGASFTGSRVTTAITAFQLMFPINSENWSEEEWDQYRAVYVTAEDDALASEAMAWTQGLSDQPNLNNYLHNISVIANAQILENRSMRFAASIISAYQRSGQDAKREAARVATQIAEEAARKVMNTDIGDVSAVIALMRGDTTGSKMRFPKIRLQLDDKTPVVLAMAGSGAMQPGTINVSNGAEFGSSNNVWFGRVQRNGQFEPNRKTDRYSGKLYVSVETASAVSALLSRLAADPMRVAAEYGKMTGNCCLCSLPLTDPRSAHVGYGPVCAKKMSWPYPSTKEVRVAMGVAA